MLNQTREALVWPVSDYVIGTKEAIEETIPDTVEIGMSCCMNG